METRGYRVRRAGHPGPPYRVIAHGRYRIGRAPCCELQVDDATVSRLHAEIEVLADGGALLLDLGSLNGSFVAGEQVSRRALSGDFELRVGGVALSFDACWVQSGPGLANRTSAVASASQPRTGPIEAVRSDVNDPG
jgi:predicted component of type VI protein secretion system